MRAWGWLAAWLGLAVFVALLGLAACGDDEERAIEQTLATLELVRGRVAIGGETARPITRLAAGVELRATVDALARVTLDRGPRILVGPGARIAVRSSDVMDFMTGRVLVSAGADEVIDVETSGGRLRIADAEVSIERRGEVLSAYVVRGDVAWLTRRDRGAAGAGNELSMSARGIEVRASTLWSDWTGGVARAGPWVGSGAGAGVGVLEARVPDEIGQARWPLVVRRLDVRVVITGELAVTDVEQVFFNPASETVEGIYRFRVPEGAVLSRFAVDRDGRLVDGFVREKEQARTDYEAQVYRGSTDDPALLEWDAPGRYHARIYPIPPGATRRIVVRYAEWLSRSGGTGPRLYRYPFGGAGGARGIAVQEMSLAVDIGSSDAARVRAGLDAKVEGSQVLLRASDFRPRSDFWLELVSPTTAASSTVVAVRAPYVRPRRAAGSRPVAHEADERDLFFVPVVLPSRVVPTGPAPEGLDLVVVADVSAATDASHLELGRSAVEALAAHLGPEDRVAFVGSDVGLRGLEREGEGRPQLGPASSARIEQMLGALARMPSGGATDLGATIAQAAALLSPDRRGAVVYVGDGAPTVGELGARELMSRIARLPQPIRLYALGVGAGAQMDLLDVITGGGGLALRVNDRAEAGDAAMRVLAHAARPIAHGVVAELGSGIDGVYPRRALDVVIGDVLPVLGRVRGQPPTQVVVRGVVAGRAFREAIPIETRMVREASEELRLRWAGERLRQILADGAGREEVTELGTRYGLITPYTSYYVPSARELRESGVSADEPEPEEEERDSRDPWGDDDEGGRGRRHRGETPARVAPGSATTPPAAMTGQPAPSIVEPPAPIAPVTAAVTAEPAPMMPAPRPTVAPTAAPAAGGGAYARGSGGFEARDAAAPTVTLSSPQVVGALAPEVVRRVVRRHINELRFCYERELAARPDLHGRVTLRFVIGQNGSVVTAALGSSTLRNAAAESCFVTAVRRWSFPAPDGGGVVSVTLPFAVANGLAHQFEPNDAPTRRARARTRVASPPQPIVEVSTNGSDAVQVEIEIDGRTERAQRPRRCGEAARLPLDDRLALWRERLAAAPSVTDWVEAYRASERACEVPGWRDRRALLEAILDRADEIGRMVDVYRALSGTAREHVRAAILRRVRTTEQLVVARRGLGLDDRVDWPAIERELAAASSIDVRIRILRRLLHEHPTSFALSLRLLAAYEDASRSGEADRLADRLRRDPWADPSVRTAVGELWLRRGRIDEARRAFSEMVELAPDDAGARRRLGDLYRAHGWFDDAYRQYRTLAQIRPDDLAVSLLLAQAAAGAGRVDEALRLEQTVAETGEPGAPSEGLARVARLWTSTRLARLRRQARLDHDEARLGVLAARARRSSAFRDAGALRVVLTWSHPDADVALWVAHPGRPVGRANDLWGEHGLEAFSTVEIDEGGDYRIEVRRNGDLRAPIEAELLIVWNEGARDERIELVPLRFEARQRSRAWTISGTTLNTI